MTDTLVRVLPRRAPHDAHAMHRAITAATTTSPGRVLWAQPVPDLLVIRSASLPDWGMIDGATACDTTTNPPVSTGDRIHWAMIANPSIRDGVGSRGNGRFDRRGTGKRIAVDEARVPAWAARKLAPALDAGGITAHRLAPARGRGITITRYAIAGEATVTDAEALADLMSAGVGAGKAFGCGLLQVGGPS